jgi:N-carbamoylputrescine amidase
MAENKLTVALVQQDFLRDRESNNARMASHIADAAAAGARLVLLPELHGLPYFCQTEDTNNFELAEPIPGPTTEFLGDLAKQHKLVIVGSIFEKRAAGLYHNTAVVLDSNGSLAGRYRRMTRLTTKNSISPRVTWASSQSIPASVVSACWCAGTSGTPRPRVQWR